MTSFTFLEFYTLVRFQEFCTFYVHALPSVDLCSSSTKCLICCYICFNSASLYVSFIVCLYSFATNLYRYTTFVHNQLTMSLVCYLPYAPK